MTGNIEIRFPADQLEGTEATVTRWLVSEGDSVAAHDPVVEVETDKVVVEIAAPEAGQIADIKIRQDEEVNPGDVLCTLSATAVSSSKQEADLKPEEQTPETSALTDRDRLSPAVKQRVLEHNLDLSETTGSGRDGRITLQDVEALIASRAQSMEAVQEIPTSSSTADSKEDHSEIIPHDRMRKRIANSMVASLLHTAPHVTAIFEADLTAVMRHRSAHKSVFADAGTPLTLTAYFIAAAIVAIQKVPAVNSRWSDENLEVFQHINMGVGTALGTKGLIVPVLHHAQNMELKDIASELSRLTTRARDNTLEPQDVRGGTFTISNHGVSGSLIATPIIINQPQSAILGIGKIEKRIKIREIDGEDVISIRPMCYVSLTIDHRVLDGYQTNTFLTELVDTLESWS
jgi:2-oxoglutarate dehydrogenase E2 component (dihydrolipoamide succinyltransferase)